MRVLSLLLRTPDQSLSLSLESSARFLLAVRIKLRCGSQAANLIPRHRSVLFCEWRSAMRWRQRLSVFQFASHSLSRSLFLSSSASYLCAAGGLLTHAFLHTISTTSCGRLIVNVGVISWLHNFCSFCAHWDMIVESHCGYTRWNEKLW
jgi:hypothetical protein